MYFYSDGRCLALIPYLVVIDTRYPNCIKVTVSRACIDYESDSVVFFLKIFRKLFNFLHLKYLKSYLYFLYVYICTFFLIL